MRKQVILFLLPLLLMTSCRSYDEASVIKASTAAVSALKTTTATVYQLSVTGHLVQFDSFEPFTGAMLPADTLDKNSKSRSYIYHAPLRISVNNFYPTNGVDSNYSESDYAYYRIKSKLTNNNDVMTHMAFKTEGNNLVFSCEGLSAELTFFHVKTGAVDGNDVYDSIAVYGRYNIALVYNEEGLLTTETIQIRNGSSDSSKGVDLVTAYSYSAE